MYRYRIGFKFPISPITNSNITDTIENLLLCIVYLWRKTNSWFHGFSLIIIGHFKSFVTWHHYKIHCTTPYLDIIIIAMLNMASPIYCTQLAFLVFAKLLGFYFFKVSPMNIVVAVILRTSILSGLDGTRPLFMWVQWN